MKSIHEICSVKFTYDQFIAPICEELLDRNCLVYASYNDEENESEKASNERTPIFLKINSSRSAKISKMIESIVSIRRSIAKSQAKIIHVHTPLLAYLARIAVMPKTIRRQTSIIYTVHGFYFHAKGKRLSNCIHFCVEWVLSTLCRKMLFVSYADYTIAKKYFPIKKERLYYIGNGVDIEIFKDHKDKAKKNRLRKQYNFNEDDYIIGFVGRYVKEKGVMELINAAIELKYNHIRKLKLMLIGGLLKSDYDGSIIKEINSKIKKYGNFITDIGFIDNKNQLAEHYNIMDAFCLPSYREGMPTSLIEAMSTGVPSIASDIRGCNELIKDKHNGILVKAGRK